ncbi:hypothetical protein SAMN05216464_101116 [Mucilaginibacter pineti]|uniref:Uncharacterized protein n=1 Tax=Mucilaginibacter pineti TaxID=1391627 RepID=A0A1G6T1K6_9SPHI|nr:hypothetical protein [Mucilaginibacter pineti]SDD22265.1 hypothetical protein SAMN05216464_101116 [Mucilaginibacter pineti]
MSDYKDSEINQNNKEERESSRGIDSRTNQSKHILEKDGPQKKHFNVLNEDGSLADLPDENVQDAGAESASITE